MNPAEWCEKMRDEAPDGDDAYAYHQLTELWEKRVNDDES